MPACRKCGENVELSQALQDEMVKIARDGTPAVEHDVCPQDADRLRRFGIEIHVVEETEGGEKTELAFFKVEHESARFIDALPVLADKLGPKWEQLQKHAALVDADPSDG